MTESDGAEVVEQSGAMLSYRAEQETQASIARSYPRNPRNSLTQALEELDIVPEYACKAFYVIPFKDKGVVKNIEGPSIKAATALARTWCNNASGWRVKDQTTERVEVEGVYIDHETNVRTLRSKTVSRFYVDKDSRKKVPLREDALVKAIAAGGSKAVRDAILAGLPVWYVDSYYKKAREIAAKMIGGRAQSKKPMTYDEKLAWVIAQLAKAQVTKDQVEAYLSGLDTDASADDNLANLIGIYNSIQDGQATAAEAFSAGRKDPAEAPMPASTDGKPAPGQPDLSAQTPASEKSEEKKPEEKKPEPPAARTMDFVVGSVAKTTLKENETGKEIKVTVLKTASDGSKFYAGEDLYDHFKAAMKTGDTQRAIVDKKHGVEVWIVGVKLAREAV